MTGTPVTGPVMTGIPVTGPGMTGIPVTGPAVTGIPVTGPAVTGTPATGTVGTGAVGTGAVAPGRTGPRAAGTGTAKVAAEGITILSVHQLLTLHFFLGMLLIGPVALKACAVLYRFVRYYTGAPEYRRKGPPAPLLRLLGPLVMITSLTVLGTGVMLAIMGPSGAGTWLFLHRASFILWFGAMTVHVLAYVWRLPRLISGDMATRAGYRAQEILAGRGARWLLLTASVVTGLLLAVLTYHRTGIWFGVGH